MEVWEQIIIEWINCLDVLKQPIRTTADLHDGAFYMGFLKLISWKNNSNKHQEDITKFIEEEYPTFKINKDDDTEHIYIASLLLLHASEKIMLHTPMCTKLQHETQIRIKLFLEKVLPVGKYVTRETMREVISELTEDRSLTPNNAKMQKTPSLKDFLNSPVARSARSYKIMTERNRELRQLKYNLEMEQCENADLREDLKIQQNKIKSLQKKLEEKSIQMKALREEHMRPISPQPSDKTDDLIDKNYYKKCIDDLECQLNKQQDEINNLETEKDVLSKKLSCIQRKSIQYKENFENCERSLECLSNKMEIKDRELVELRMHNEELRVYVKEFSKKSITEQSFEIEDIMLPQSTRISLNTSEVLSSVIEIQLQEAKEESAVLHAQVDSLKGKLGIITKDYKNAIEFNKGLQNKVKILNKVEIDLNNVQKELHASNIQVAQLEAEKISFISQNKDLKSSLSSTDKKLSEIQYSNTMLNTDLNDLKLKIESMNELLEKEKSNSSDLNTALEEIKLQEKEHIAHIHKLTDEKEIYESSINSCSEILKKVLHYSNQFIQIKINNLDKLTPHEFTKCFETILQKYNAVCTSNKCNIEKLKTTIEETNTSLFNEQLIVKTLEEQNKENVVKMADIVEDRKQKDLMIHKQEEIIHNHLQEIEILKQIKSEKQILEQDIFKLNSDLTNQKSLLKSALMYLEVFQDLSKTFKLIKQDTQQRFTKYQEDIKITFREIYNNYEMLNHNLENSKREKTDIEYKFNQSKDELLNVQKINTALQQNILENKEVTCTLEKQVRVFCDELNESKENTKKLKEVIETLENQHTKITIEANNNLESLKLENTNISLDLKSSIDKLALLQTQMCDAKVQLEFKNTYINELLSDVSVLKADKEHLINSQQELLKIKNEEVHLKEEALLSMQNKMERLTNEAIISEKQMKEIIINLQEVRSSQDAVLVTQETALKEKCLHMEELQKQFDKSKEILNKQLEHEKSLHSGLQIKISELENQIHKQDNDIGEFQEKLKIISTELKVSEDRCKFMDANQAELVKLCQELEHPTKNLNSTIIDTCPDFDIISKNSCVTLQYIYADNKTENILSIIKMTLDELHISQKAILHLSRTNTELNKTLGEQKLLIENSIKDKEEIRNFQNKVQELELMAQKRNDYLNSLIKNKELLKESLQKIIESRNDSDTILVSLKQKWNDTLTKFQGVFQVESSVCDEFKQLRIKKANLEDTLFKYRTDHFKNIRFISDILWEKFLWTEKKLYNTYLCSIHEKECLDLLTTLEEDKFSDIEMTINVELQKNKMLQANIIKSEEEIQSFLELAISYENGLKSGEIQTQADIEKKLHVQINQLTKENKNLKDKLDTMRTRHIKLERNIDDLRTEIKKVKSENNPTDHIEELQSLKNQLEHLKVQNMQLHKEKDESSKNIKHEFESQLKEIHATYERKLEDMKQKMKIAFNEQIAKLNTDQEKIIRERLHNQMELMCQKQREEINRYKAHVGELSSQLWSVGEKLLIEQQQKQESLQRLKEVQIKLKDVEATQQISAVSHKTTRLEKQDMISENIQQGTQKMTMITEETFERKRVRSMQAIGNVFKTEDEEEVFDNVYLADMKRGHNLPTTDVDRLSVLKMRNSLCKPHLKSSYPAEMQFLPMSLTEEEIKTGSITEDIFNDSLSQSLLPEQKTKKKDRSQTSYKKPGPPTPSKNGGRLSLQGNELRSPSARVLKEWNMDRRATVTPHKLKNKFTLKRQDENASTTPKGRRLSNIFRKSRLQSDR